MRTSISALKPRRRRRLSVDVLEARQLLATITVNSTADDSTADATLSLREAIEVSNGTLSVSSLSMQEQAEVNGAVGPTNTIDFNIPKTDPGYSAATGVWTIAVQSELPTISSNAAIIDGYSQPGASKNTLAQGDNATLTIAISGTGASAANGLTINQQGSQVFGLDIENFDKAGVLITAGGNVQVAGCFIGTDPKGESAAPNDNGVAIENSFNTIGGPNVSDRNVISGNNKVASAGVYVLDPTVNPLGILVTGTVVENNLIGLDATGTKRLGNEDAGVVDYGSGDTYGGAAAGLGNVISGNGQDGLDSYRSITIEGNYVGTDVTGNVALGNGPSMGSGEGIVNDEVFLDTSITTTISNNVVSGNAEGIEVSMQAGSQSTYTIANNLIGTNAAGTAALGNGDGLRLVSVENATVQNNVISGNNNGAVTVVAPGATNEPLHDVFLGNLIGTDKTGAVALGNHGTAIAIVEASGITIGGTGPGQANVIANNDYGIVLTAGQQDQFLRNSVYANLHGGLSVSGNESAVAPVLTFAPGTGNSGTLSGTLTSAPNSVYDVQIYSNPSAPVPGMEQGKTFIQDVTVNTDGSGKGSFSLTLPIGFYTATATDSLGNTSEYSNAAGVQALAATVTAVTSSSNPSTVGQQVTFTAVVTASGFAGTPTGTVTFSIDGQALSPVQLSVKGGKDEAQFVTTKLSAGSHTVSASYSGDNNVSVSSGSLPTQTVTAPHLAATTTTLASSLNPAAVGQPVTFVAMVSPSGTAGTPSGTVTFTIDGVSQAPVPLHVVSTGDRATLSITTLSAGKHTIDAVYNGDATFASSTPKNALTQFVGLQATTTTLGSSANPSQVGEQIIVTATVDPPTGTGDPTGNVTFVVDGKAEMPVPLHEVDGSDRAAFSIASLTPGTHTISATYDGDTAFASSNVSTPLTEVVQGATGEGPTVVSVRRYGVHMQPTVLVLTFSTALELATALDPQNYVIVSPAGQRLGIGSVVYNAAVNTVTLRPRQRIDVHDDYRLTVIGTGASGVKAADGTPLDAVPGGGAGNNFVTTLSWKNLVLGTPVPERHASVGGAAQPWR